jgi:hypothetical protein
LKTCRNPESIVLSITVQIAIKFDRVGVPATVDLSMTETISRIKKYVPENANDSGFLILSASLLLLLSFGYRSGFGLFVKISTNSKVARLAHNVHLKGYRPPCRSLSMPQSGLCPVLTPDPKFCILLIPKQERSIITGIQIKTLPGAVHDFNEHAGNQTRASGR